MDIILKYFAGPLIAAALTTFFVWFKGRAKGTRYRVPVFVSYRNSVSQ